MTDGSRAPDELDTRVIDILLLAQIGSLVIVLLLTITILSGWLVPSIATVLPPVWSLMKANTALGFFFVSVALILLRTERGAWRRGVAAGLGLAVLVLSTTALIGHALHHPLALETLLNADSLSDQPGRMSTLTAAFLALAGVTLVIDGTRICVCRGPLDALALILAIIVLTLLAGYLFDASALYAVSETTRTSPQTLLGMVLVTFSLAISRMKQGYFSILAGIGIGSHMARLALPWVALPYLIISLHSYLQQTGWLSPNYVDAVMASIFASLLLLITLVMAHKINGLEQDLRDMSLNDELTRIYNRRGFNLLGERMLMEGRRNEAALAILYFDLDGLKTVNDTLGHSVGSELIKDFADLLKSTFRSNDLVARLGGDEFAVLTHDMDVSHALQRLALATQHINSNDRPYQIRYSVGETIDRAKAIGSFEEFVAQADRAMYEQKRARKRQKMGN